MYPYWLIFLAAAGMAVALRRGQNSGERRALEGLWDGFFIGLTILIGLRHEVGGDWYNYLRILELARDERIASSLAGKDLAYSLVNWFAVNAWGGIYLVNSVCALFFAWGLYHFCRVQPRPWLAVVVSVPYLITVVAMGYSRQGVAIGLAMLGLVALADGRLLRFLCWMVLAAIFHKSAIILVPLALFHLKSGRYRLWAVAFVGLATALLYELALRDTLAHWQSGYLDAGYDSSGAAVRIAMNALPAAFFLFFRKRFQLEAAPRRFWTLMSLLALGFVPLLWLLPSTTAVDRIALYWIPLQVFVWSRVPDMVSGKQRRRSVWVYGIVAYSAAVLFVWLFFAVHAFAWVPYQFYPWVALMEWMKG